MVYYASILPNSIIDRSWRAHGRIGGDVGTIRFTLLGNVFMTSKPLTPDQVMAAQAIPSIRLEAAGNGV